MSSVVKVTKDKIRPSPPTEEVSTERSDDTEDVSGVAEREKDKDIKDKERNVEVVTVSDPGQERVVNKKREREGSLNPFKYSKNNKSKFFTR